ncbi:LPD1 domain-containing protein [Butyrivibrio proteoclasticus]|nr:LPD1 domain-containing protein [Butyrivibrio proteoclasticus]
MGIANKHRFGEEIPMSRADIAVGTIGLMEYDELNETEKDKCLKRDFIWKAPNMKKLKAENANMDLVFWQNEIRKSLYTRPARTHIDDYRRKYVSAVTSIRDKVMNATEPCKILVDGQQVSFISWAKEQFTSGSYVSSDASCAVTSTTFTDWDPKQIHRCVVKQRFGFTPEEAAMQDANEDIWGFIYDGMCPSDRHLMKPDKFYRDNESWHDSEKSKCFMVGCSSAWSYYHLPNATAELIKEGYAVVTSLRSHKVLSICKAEELEKTLNDVRKAFIAAKLDVPEKEIKRRKRKFVPEKLDTVRQIGGMDADSLIAVPENFMEVFHFRGGEWGNWLNADERVLNLTMCYNSFFNMANILGIKPECTSLGDMMSIAFGSRGRSSASAHFEPGGNVINLTRMSGAGCLAHEWGHALDYYLAKRYEIPAEFATEAKIHFEKDGTFYRTWDILPKEFVAVYYAIEDAKEFLKGSKKFDELFTKNGHGYWSSNCELWARAFDCYISDKLKAAGIIDTYLSRGADSFYWEENGIMYRAYPAGEERNRINKAFDDLIKHLFVPNTAE